MEWLSSDSPWEKCTGRMQHRIFLFAVSLTAMVVIATLWYLDQQPNPSYIKAPLVVNTGYTQPHKGHHKANHKVHSVNQYKRIGNNQLVEEYPKGYSTLNSTLSVSILPSTKQRITKIHHKANHKSQSGNQQGGIVNNKLVEEFKKESSTLSSNLSVRFLPSIEQSPAKKAEATPTDKLISNKKPTNDKEVILTAQIVVDANRRLGNFLFQFAAMYGIARKNGFQPCQNMPASILRDFENITSVVKPLLEDNNNVDEKGRLKVTFPEKEHKGRSFDGNAFHLRENLSKDQHLIIIGGFRQSWKYFSHVWNRDLEHQMKCSGAIHGRVESFLKAALSGKPNDIVLVSVHVRRGDFQHKYMQKRGYTLSNMTYIGKAMDYFEKYYGHVAFIVASDGLDWAKENINSSISPIIFSPFTLATDDLCLLAECNASIITGGSYGWWGAYMAGGPVVYDKLFPREDSGIGRRYTKDDYYPRDWVGL